jgi:hypothetical protein
MFLTILNEVLKRNDKQCLKHQWKFENIPRSSNWEKHLQNTAGLVFMRETHSLVCHEVSVPWSLIHGLQLQKLLLYMPVSQGFVVVPTT